MKYFNTTKLKVTIFFKNIIQLSIFLISSYLVYNCIFMNKKIVQRLNRTESILHFSNKIQYSNEIPYNFSNLTNPHDYKLILQPSHDTCTNSTILLVLVTIAPDFFAKRKTIRNTWASSQKDIKVFFLLGSSSNNDMNEKIKLESMLFKDIVQEDFLDSYYNLTIKVMMGFKWIDNYCKSAKFVMKIDDDVVVNTRRVIRSLKYLSSKSFDNKTMIGNCFQRPLVKRIKTEKFYIPSYVFPNEYFPPFCGGSVYILTRDLIGLLYRRSLVTYFPPFSNFYEDVYIGMLLKRLQFKTNFINIQRYFSANFRTNYVPIEKIAQRDKNYLLFVYIHHFGDYEAAWNIIK